MKKSQPNETMLLNRALRIAAVEAYYADVLDTGLYKTTIGTGNEFPTADAWIRDRMAKWIHEAELRQNEGD